MQALLAGIYSKLTTGTPAIYTTVGGRIYFHEVPDNIAGSAKNTFPYLVYSVISLEPTYRFASGSVELEEAIVQFSLYSDKSSSTEANTMYTQLNALLQHSSLTVSGYNSLLMQRENARLVRDVTRRTWHYAVDYMIIIQEQPA